MVQKLRESYKPEVVKSLYVAESPPANGTFFYRCDSSLFDALHRAFVEVFGNSCGDDRNFLSFFKSRGCYLDDLWLRPIHDLGDAERRYFREIGVTPLATRISEMAPEAVVILMLGIEAYVRRAISGSGVMIEHIYATLFPAHGPQNIERCVKENVAILRLLISKGILQGKPAD